MDKLEATEGQDSALMSKSGSVSTSYQSSRVLYPCSVQCFPNSTSEESMSADRASTLFKVTGLVCGEPGLESHPAVWKMLANANSPQLVVKRACFIQNFTSILKFMDLSLNFRV